MHISLQLFVFYGIYILKSCVFHAHQFATAHVLWHSVFEKLCLSVCRFSVCRFIN